MLEKAFPTMKTGFYNIIEMGLDKQTTVNL